MSPVVSARLIPALASIALMGCFDFVGGDKGGTTTGGSDGGTADGGCTSDGGTPDGGASDGGGTDGGASDGGTDGGGTDGGASDGGGTDGGGTDGGSTDGGGTDGGGTDGGGTDGGGTDGGTTSTGPFTPTFLLFDATSGVIDGVQGDVMLSGTSLGHQFTALLINDDWTGVDDTANFCAVTFDTDGADVDRTCTDCWRGLAWSVDSTTPYTTSGECAGLDPAVWTDDVGDYFASMTYGYGFGPASTDFLSTLESTYSSDWSTYGDVFISNYVRTDLAGTTDWYELNYGLVYEVDRDGNLVEDSTGAITLLDAGLETSAPDGYYTSGYYYGFGL